MRSRCDGVGAKMLPGRPCSRACTIAVARTEPFGIGTKSDTSPLACALSSSSLGMYGRGSEAWFTL